MRFALTILALVPAAALAQEPTLAIRNATVETLAAAGRLEKATVVIRDGKVTAVGKDVAVPDDATVIDAAGGTVMPGIIDPHFEVNIAAGAPDGGQRTVVIQGRTINLPAAQGRAGGYTRVADNFYPFDPGFKPLPRAGLTRLNLVTGGSGQAAVVRVTPADPRRMLDRPDGVPFASVTNSSESLDQVRTRLEGASRAKSGSSAPGAALWADVLAGKTSLVAAPNNSAAVLHLLKAVEPYKNVKLVMVMTGGDIAETAPALKGRSVSVVLRPGLDLLPNTRDRFNPARMLHEAGVEFAFSLSTRPQTAATGAAAALNPDAEPPAPITIDPEFPLFPVAMLVKTGLPRAAALEALAKRPAAMTGLGATHGTVEPGKAADLLIYTGDPLDPGSRLVRTLIDGRTVYAN